MADGPLPRPEEIKPEEISPEGDAAPPASADASGSPPAPGGPTPPSDAPIALEGDVAGLPDEALRDAAPPLPTPSPETPPTMIPSVVEVRDFDWRAVRQAVDPPAIRARMRGIVERMEMLLDRAGGPGLLFDADRLVRADQAIRVSSMDAASPLWIIGDLHGDLLALEAALALIRDHARRASEVPRIIFLGDLFDDGGFGLETLLRVFEVIADAPERICVIAGNHDEALSYDGVRFASSVVPSDFADFLNANLAHEWIERAGKVAVRLFACAPRALFLPDGLLVAHGGFPLVDLHPRLTETGNWNDPACLADFVWTRQHMKARRKLPNRFSRGSQFGYEDFADFCALSAALGRPVTHMVRGHDHVEERFAIPPAFRAHPVLTTVALSRRLDREHLGPFERAPTVALVVEGVLPEVYCLFIPADMIRDVYPEPAPGDGSGVAATGETPEGKQA